MFVFYSTIYCCCGYYFSADAETDADDYLFSEEVIRAVILPMKASKILHLFYVLIEHVALETIPIYYFPCISKCINEQFNHKVFFESI